MNAPDDTYKDWIINNISNQLIKKLDDYIIEGLKRKGYEFNNRIELENFIRLNCRCEDKTDIKERIYYVNDIPFFIHYYQIDLDLIPIDHEGEIKLSANYGQYVYL